MEQNENFKEELETQYSILNSAKEKVEKIRFIFIISILIITLISVIISVFFAYQAFKSSKTLSDFNESQYKTYYQTLSTIFNNTDSLNLDNISTGYRLENPKVIEITNEGNANITFNIKIVSISTTLLTSNNLFYTLTKNGETTLSKQLPLNEKIIASDIEIKPQETITYIINVYFNGVIDQTETNNYYHSKILVEQIDNKSDLLE